MRSGQEVSSGVRVAATCAWTLANGLRGSAAGSVATAWTDPWHALLTAASVDGSLTSVILDVDERLLVANGTFPLRAEPALGRPACQLESFALDPWPTWRYEANGVRLEKTLFMIYGHNAVAIRYRHVAGPEARVTSCPLLVARPPGELQQRIGGASGAAEAIPGRVRIEISPGMRLTLWHDGGFMPARASRRIVHGSDERTHEETLVVGYVERPLSAGSALHVIASAEDDLFRVLAQEDRLGAPPPKTLAACVVALEIEERERVRAWRNAAFEGANATARQARAARARASTRTTEGGERASEPRSASAGGIDPPAAPPPATTPIGDEHLVIEPEPGMREDDPWIAMLAESLRTALVRRDRRLTMVASYPLAEERTESVLRALPGLIALRGFASVREILAGLIDYVDDGLLPSEFSADGRPGLGSTAASLWLIIVSELYARRSGDSDFARDLAYPTLANVSHFLRSGTRTGVHVNDNGLLVSVEDGESIARTDLNVLWSHAQVAMAHIARAAGRREHAAFHLAWAREHQQRLTALLWDEKRRCLVRALAADGVRPGLDSVHVLAASLPPALLAPERAAMLVRTLERELFTPFGLRDTPRARAVSTEWLGAFFTAYLRVHQRSHEAHTTVRGWMGQLAARLPDSVVGHIPMRFPAPAANRLAGSRMKARATAAARGAEADATGGTRRGADSVSVSDDLVHTTISPLAAAELLRFWIEEVEHAVPGARREPTPGESPPSG